MRTCFRVWARVSADPVLEAEAQVHAKPSLSQSLLETGTLLPLSTSNTPCPSFTPPIPPTASLLLPLDAPGLSKMHLSVSVGVGVRVGVVIGVGDGVVAGSMERSRASARETDWLTSLSAWLHH